MTKKTKPSVTYIKNGVENTVFINKFNQKKLEQELFDGDYSRYFLGIGDQVYILKEDIEYVCFSCVSFLFDSVNFRCAGPSVLILDNCKFGRSLEFDRINYDAISVEVIKPHFTKRNVNFKIRSRGINDLRIVFEDKSLLPYPKYNFDVFDSRKVSLKGEIFADWLFFGACNHLELTDCEINTSSDIHTWFSDVKMTRSVIFSSREIEMYGLEHLMLDEKSNIVSTKRVLLAHNDYKSMDNKLVVISLDELFKGGLMTSRKKLIHCLKEYKNDLVSKINSDTCELKKTLYLEKEVKKYEDMVAKKKARIKKQVTDYKKELENKSISEL